MRPRTVPTAIASCLLLLALAAFPAHAADEALRHAWGTISLHMESDLDALAADVLDSGLAQLPGQAGAVPLLQRVRDLGKGRASGVALTVLGIEEPGGVRFVGVFDAGAGIEALRAIFSGGGSTVADLEADGRKGLLVSGGGGEQVILPSPAGKRFFVMGTRDAAQKALAAAEKPAKQKPPIADLRTQLPKAGRGDAFSLAARFTPALRDAAKTTPLPEALKGFGIAFSGKSLALRFETDRAEEAAALAAELAGAAKLAEGLGALAPNDPTFVYAKMAAEVGRRAKVEAKGPTVHVTAELETGVLKMLTAALGTAAAPASGGSPEASLHVCRSALRVLDGAGDLCRLDHPGRKVEELTVEALQRDGYLKATPVCPDGGSFKAHADGEKVVWRCSKHDAR